MKVIAFQNVTTCSLVDTYKHFGGTRCLHFRVGCHDTEGAYSTEKLVLCGVGVFVVLGQLGPRLSLLELRALYNLLSFLMYICADHVFGN